MIRGMMSSFLLISALALFHAGIARLFALDRCGNTYDALTFACGALAGMMIATKPPA